MLCLSVGLLSSAFHTINPKRLNARVAKGGLRHAGVSDFVCQRSKVRGRTAGKRVGVGCAVAERLSISHVDDDDCVRETNVGNVGYFNNSDT